MILTVGLMLSGWILIQMIFLRTVNNLHIIMGTTGVLLMTIGLLLMEKEEEVNFLILDKLFQVFILKTN